MIDNRLHPCARCAQMQRTCCQRAEILLTAGDVARIRAHTDRTDFHEHRVPADPAYVEHDPADPDWSALTVDHDGRRRVLVRRMDGACTFLGEHGCVLPGESRPLVCRLYPFTYTAAGLVSEDPEYCPSVLLRESGGTMLSALGMARAEGERWRAQLYDELRATHVRVGGAV